LIGAQAAMPGRQVVTLSGDGGIAMLLCDLLTLRQLNLPVKVVVFNDGSLGFVELEMKAAGWPSYGTDLVKPNFAKRPRLNCGESAKTNSVITTVLRTARFGPNGPR
jgi:thiamine pyrophosphate-dependent acetolactate synthase large subunit-like protein